ncbi:MAG: AP2 domain-containing protein [Phycisphaerales bacterium]
MQTGSRFKGVWFEKRVGKWRATIHIKGKSIWIGHFATEEEAARAYDRRAVELFGEFARLNFPEEWPAERRAEVAGKMKVET